MKEHRERIFISGPMTPRGCSPHRAPQVLMHNIDKAIEVSNMIIMKGHYVFVPHLNFYIHTHYSCHTDYGEFWYEVDNTFLDNWATALYYIGSSVGSDNELARAKKKHLKIYRVPNEVPDVGPFEFNMVRDLS